MRENIYDKLSNVLVNSPTRLHSLNNRLKTIVKQNNVRSLTSNICPRSTHRNTNISFPQRGSIIRAITSNSNNLTALFQNLNNAKLLLWRNTRKNHVSLLNLIHNRIVTQVFQVYTANNLATPFFNYANLLSNDLRSWTVVSSDNHRFDASLFRFQNS